MHQIHVNIILLAVAIEPVAQKHGLSETQLCAYLRQALPLASERLVRGASALAVPGLPPGTMKP
jgi:hypothetical protein